MKDERINLCFPGGENILLADGNSIDLDSLFTEFQNPTHDEFYTWSLVDGDKFVKNKIKDIYLLGNTWDIINLNLTDGTRIRCTLNQQIKLKTGEFVGASEFPMDKPMLRKDGKDTTILSKTQTNLKEVENVYLIELEDDYENLTLSDGIVVKSIRA